MQTTDTYESLPSRPVPQPRLAGCSERLCFRAVNLRPEPYSPPSAQLQAASCEDRTRINSRDHVRFATRCRYPFSSPSCGARVQEYAGARALPPDATPVTTTINRDDPYTSTDRCSWRRGRVSDVQPHGKHDSEIGWTYKLYDVSDTV